MIHKTAALIGASLLALSAAPALADDHAHDESTETLQSAEAAASGLPKIGRAHV